MNIFKIISSMIIIIMMLIKGQKIILQNKVNYDISLGLVMKITNKFIICYKLKNSNNMDIQNTAKIYAKYKKNYFLEDEKQFIKIHKNNILDMSYIL